MELHRIFYRIWESHVVKIEVTDVGTGAVETYDYSRDNWAHRWACMRGGLVYMWAPPQCVPGIMIRTSGRLWHVLKQ